jgi:hypothetical protein
VGGIPIHLLSASSALSESGFSGLQDEQDYLLLRKKIKIQ